MAEDGKKLLHAGFEPGIRWTSTHSWFLVFLTVLDAAIIWLTVVEYRRIKGSG